MNGQRMGAAVGLGAVTGLRNLTGLAMVSRELSQRRRLPRHASRLEEWLAADTVAIALSAMALGEMAADKLPAVPARIRLGPLLSRALTGGALGAIAGGREERALGAVAGAAGAVAGAFAGWALRREAARWAPIPDTAVALAEDAMAIAAARELVKEL